MYRVVAKKVARIYLKKEKYENCDDGDIKNIFINKIVKITGEGELLPYHEYYINYKRKNCIFYDFDIDYETGEKLYTIYKIILKLSTKPRPKRQNLLFNIFIFNY